MSRRGLALVETHEPREAEFVGVDPHAIATDQAQRALDALRRPAEDYLHFPLETLDAVIGGVPKGSMVMVNAFSGDGKTTLLSSCAVGWSEEQKKRVGYWGLESTPPVMRTHFACKKLGLDAGDLLSGAYLAWPNATEIRAQVAAELKAMSAVPKSERRLLISEATALDVRTVRNEAAIAADAGVEVLIVDHVDHLAGAGNLYDLSVAVNRALLDAAHEYGFWVIAASQFNNDAVKGNRVLRHLMPQPSYVYMGGHKRQICDVMLGLYKPLKIAGVDKATLKKFKEGAIQAREVLEPNTMAVGVMKHRLYGAREGQRVYLRVEHGRAMDLEDREAGLPVHGIRTNRDVA